MRPEEVLGDWMRPVHDGIQLDLSPVQRPPTPHLAWVMIGGVSLMAGYTGVVTGSLSLLAAILLGMFGLLVGAGASALLARWLATWPSEILVTRESTSLRIDIVAAAGKTSRRIALDTVERVVLREPNVVLETTDGTVVLPVHRSDRTRMAVVAVLRTMLQTDIAGAEHVPAALKRVIGQEA